MVAHKSVARCFVCGEKAKGNNMFTDGKVIYSYGEHFPIALRLKSDWYLFNTDKYSQSTSKHQSYVRRELDGYIGAECSTSEIKNAIRFPDEPIVITKTEGYCEVDECFERIKELYKKKGLTRVPINKMKKLLKDWEIMKRI
jgi:hypothetical protein